MGWWEDMKRDVREGERKRRAEVEAKARAKGKEPPADMSMGKALLVLAVTVVVGGFLAITAVGAVIDVVAGSDEAEPEERDQRAQGEDQPSAGGDARAASAGVLVVRVIDGDTVDLEGIGRSRLIGVDTPEEGECYETAATRYMKRTVEGQRVRVAFQAERRDRFDRALVDIYKSDRLIALELARLGYAEELTIEPNDRFAPRIRAAVERAESRGRGRWNTCDEGGDRARERDEDRRRRDRERERDRERSSPSPTPAPEPEPEPERDPEPQAPSVPSGTCDEVGINNFPVPPGDPRDRDNDGIACES